MPNKVNGIIDRIKDSNSWLRILLMFGYLVVLYVIALLAVVIMVAQTLFVFASGAPNSNLIIFGEALAEYIKQIIDFLFYKSNTKPFPFAPFPIINFIANFVWTSLISCNLLTQLRRSILLYIFGIQIYVRVSR